MTGRVGDSKYYNINDNDAGTVDKKRRNNPEGQARLRRGNEMERTKEVFLVDIAVCVGYSKNTTASKKPPWFSSRNIGHLAMPVAQPRG
jgi:hypothetical protein